MQNQLMNLKRSILLNLFLSQQLLGANDNFLSNIMIFCLIQQHNCHICQRGLLFVHHFHSPQSWGLHHQYSQKVASLNLKLLPPNLMNLAFFVSMKLIPLWYLTRTKVLMTAVMLLDLQVLLVDQVWMQNSRPFALYPSPEYLHAIS